MDKLKKENIVLLAIAVMGDYTIYSRMCDFKSSF